RFCRRMSAWGTSRLAAPTRLQSAQGRGIDAITAYRANPPIRTFPQEVYPGGIRREQWMAIVFITGSSDGLGRAAAQSLLDGGHKVVLHARSSKRAATIASLASRSLGVVVGDLSSAAETRDIADQVNAIGRMDAVIHNAGIYSERGRGSTPEGHAGILAVNTLAPYILTALIARPDRLVYLSSGLHSGGAGSLGDLDWKTRTWDHPGK